MPVSRGNKYCSHDCLHTVAKELVLRPVADDDECTASAFFVLGCLCFPPLHTPLAFDNIQRREECILDETGRQPSVGAVVHLEHP